MPRKIIVVVCLALLAPVAFAADSNPFAFRGAALGSTEQQFVQQLPYFACRDSRNRIVGDRLCTVTRQNADAMRFGPVVARNITAYGYGNTIGKVSINVPSCKGEQLAKLRDFLNSSLGASPKTSNLRTTTQERWSSGTFLVELMSYARGRCIVTYETTGYVDELDARASTVAGTRPKEM